MEMKSTGEGGDIKQHLEMRYSWGRVSSNISLWSLTKSLIPCQPEREGSSHPVIRVVPFSEDGTEVRGFKMRVKSCGENSMKINNIRDTECGIFFVNKKLLYVDRDIFVIFLIQVFDHFFFPPFPLNFYPFLRILPLQNLFLFFLAPPNRSGISFPSFFFIPLDLSYFYVISVLSPNNLALLTFMIPVYLAPMILLLCLNLSFSSYYT